MCQSLEEEYGGMNLELCVIVMVVAKVREAKVRCCGHNNTRGGIETGQ